MSRCLRSARISEAWEATNLLGNHKKSSRSSWKVCIMKKMMHLFNFFLHVRKLIVKFHFPQTFGNPLLPPVSKEMVSFFLYNLQTLRLCLLTRKLTSSQTPHFRVSKTHVGAAGGLHVQWCFWEVFGRREAARAFTLGFFYIFALLHFVPASRGEEELRQGDGLSGLNRENFLQWEKAIRRLIHLFI